jgi:hypothetical protein
MPPSSSRFFRRTVFSICSLVFISACATGTLTTSTTGGSTAPAAIDISSDLADVGKALDNRSQQFDPEGILIVFDIDNTLLTMPQFLGSDHWYTWQREQQRSGSEYALDCLLDTQGLLFNVSPMQLTQADAADIIARLQTKGISIMALTARDPDFRYPTERELARQGIDLSKTAPRINQAAGQGIFARHGGRNISYLDGVMMVSGLHKGDQLAWLREHMTRSYSHVIFVDDNARNTQAMRETYPSSQAATIIHYTRIESHTTGDSERTNQELNSLVSSLREHFSRAGNLIQPPCYIDQATPG